MLIILSIGLVMVLSASGIVAEQVNGDKYYFFKRQVIFAFGGGVALWGAALLPGTGSTACNTPRSFWRCCCC